MMINRELLVCHIIGVGTFMMTPEYKMSFSQRYYNYLKNDKNLQQNPKIKIFGQFMSPFTNHYYK